MAAPGTSVSETILVEASSVKSVAQRVTLAMTQTGDYVLAATRPRLLEFERRFKPSWGLGALSKVERCSITVEQAPAATVVRIDGSILPERLDAVRAAAVGRSVASAALDAVLGKAEVTPTLDGLEDVPPPITRPGKSIPAPFPVPQRPHTQPDSKPVPAVGALGGSGPIRPMPAGGPSHSELSASSPIGRTGSQLLYLDLGELGTVPIDGRIVLGRDPQLPDGTSGKAVRIADATVSKTHCWIEPAGDEVKIYDLHSTNGTSVIDRHGRRVAVNPDSPSLAGRDTTVALGDFMVVVTGG